ncbi:MAG: DUF1460 domain-containing protein [Ignavibacteriales bacterium CG12_big_fil_rev_8_21_14_0_65_30_8]|nr:MAG: DUF1460 domain-containing protein [Ignavibacteriales bacterium CG12_big_fil_rev_8_21_14_0_65_30_8]
MKANFLIILFILFNISISSQIYTQKDVEIFKNLINKAQQDSLQNESIGKIIVEIGKQFIGTDYIAHSLEVGDKEDIVVNLRNFDCTTFLDNSLVLARLIKSNDTSFTDYTKELTKERYRNGKLNQYPSRLHYFTDWIYDAEKRGLIKNISKEIGGKLYCKKIFFMSKNYKLYKQLSNEKFLEEIKQTEKEINKRKYYYVSKEMISKVEDKIKTGDLIAITTSVEGLDIAHVGIAIRMEDGRIHYLHAPNIGQKVKISEKPLSDYLMGNNAQTGIMVARALEPK